ncbi:MAG: winged helix-turn-helix transcriptional regulator [Solirubrobacteraceae bacterium]|nr:winged helix-turn-helix transcriptional regulator [Solirubrobacteraceae bacterium]
MVVSSVPPDDVDRLFQALADATRRDILGRAIETDLSVSALARHYAISLTAVQKHVAVLERAGLVRRERVGREMRVHAVRGRIQAVREQLDAYEQLWRHRVAAMDDLLTSPPTLSERKAD